MRTISSCRSCGSTSLEEMFDLGEQYVSDFRRDSSKPNKYPLVAVICTECKLVQLKNTTPSGDMYHDNYGFKSGISDSIKADLREIVSCALDYVPQPSSWLDIASNDGTLLSYVPTSAYRVGVDPITFLCDEAKQHADRIVNSFYSYDAVQRKFDVITSISCFYDMDDPNGFVSDVAKALEDDGIWVIQQNYLLPTMQLGAVDNFCHEHLEYYTVLSLKPLLERHGLEIVEISTSMVNGGSLRTFVAKTGARTVHSSVAKQEDIEQDANLSSLASYKEFGSKAIKQLEALKKLVDDINAEGKTVFILAASTRGATIWQGAGLTEVDVPYAVERNPAKVGRYFSAVGMPIISEEEARALKPDYMIIGPWFFVEEIAARESDYVKRGGKLIVPLPELMVIDE